MATETAEATITVRLTGPAARAYQSGDPAARRTMELLARFHLEHLLARPARGWDVVTAEVEAEARANGLTDEALDALLSEPDDGGRS